MRIKVGYCPTGPMSVICSISEDDYHLQPYKIADLDNNEALCALSEIARVLYVIFSNGFNLFTQLILLNKK
jgi:hypothetical protein